jgi:phosphoribosyl-ATP pyrophosphohydrolase
MAEPHILDALSATVASRKGADPASSYTAKLFAKGRKKIAQKVGEEGVETAIAAVSETNEAVVSESADLLYHLTVLWADCGIKPEQVWKELQKRVGTSGLDEKKSRKG